ncbi:hypothetical protein [Saccharothrix sp. HUAS TT1]
MRWVVFDCGEVVSEPTAELPVPAERLTGVVWEGPAHARRVLSA